MPKGGPRPGSGRPKGTTDIPRISTYFTRNELKKFIDNLKKRAETSDKIATFLAEHVWGKAPQPISGDFTGTLTITFDNAFHKKE